MSLGRKGLGLKPGARAERIWDLGLGLGWAGAGLGLGQGLGQGLGPGAGAGAGAGGRGWGQGQGQQCLLGLRRNWRLQRQGNIES